MPFSELARFPTLLPDGASVDSPTSADRQKNTLDARRLVRGQPDGGAEPDVCLVKAVRRLLCGAGNCDLNVPSSLIHSYFTPPPAVS